jgi:carbon storage regulator
LLDSLAAAGHFDPAPALGRLALTRKVDEAIQIGKDITVTVAEIRGAQVKMCIEAPKTVRIFRSELLRPSTT